MVYDPSNDYYLKCVTTQNYEFNNIEHTFTDKHYSGT